MKGAMCSTRVGLWVEEVNLNGECIILVQAGVNVVLYLLMSSFIRNEIRTTLYCCNTRCMHRQDVKMSRCRKSSTRSRRRVVLYRQYESQTPRMGSKTRPSSHSPPAPFLPTPCIGCKMSTANQYIGNTEERRVVALASKEQSRSWD